MSVAAVDLTGVSPGLDAAVGARMEQVERGLHAAVSTDEPVVSEAARHLLAAGGKRFRPLLALVAAQLGDADAPGVVPAALVVELTHLATLYHDDVMDEAVLRRGAPAANRVWGNSVAILTGDFLFARASDIAADLGVDIVRIQARTFARLVRGQIRETVGPAGGVDPLRHYLSVVADKTASLVSTAARFGGMTAGVDAATVEILAEFGERIGVAFQLADDLLDVTSDAVRSGKLPGTDLREGVRTLPVLLALRSVDPADARLRELVSRPLTDEAQVAQALALLRAHPAVEEASRIVVDRADRARETLRALPAGPARDALDAVAVALAVRDR